MKYSPVKDVYDVKFHFKYRMSLLTTEHEKVLNKFN